LACVFYTGIPENTVPFRSIPHSDLFHFLLVQNRAEFREKQKNPPRNASGWILTEYHLRSFRRRTPPAKKKKKAADLLQNLLPFCQGLMRIIVEKCHKLVILVVIPPRELLHVHGLGYDDTVSIERQFHITVVLGDPQ